MADSTSGILDVLRAYNIQPDGAQTGDIDLPGIGVIKEGESVYQISIAEVFRDDVEDDKVGYMRDADDPRVHEWLREIERFIGRQSEAYLQPHERRSSDPPEPHCAWYCPIHFFGHGWGIYVREACILSHAMDIATFVDWPSVRAPRWEVPRQLLRSAFYVFFLHEQFHHKVESLGLRLLVATSRDRYRPYKANVYRPTFQTQDCLEESLANAESVRRLGEDRYLQRLDKSIRMALRRYLKASIPGQPPGYAEGMNYLSETRYRNGVFRLQSQILDGRIKSGIPAAHWSIAPKMITALTDITDHIYVILPSGAWPIFRWTSIDPGATVSSWALEGALTKHYGYQHVTGGKGSHVKLTRPGAPMIIIPGNRPVVSPDVVKNVLAVFGRYPLSRIGDLVDGRLPNVLAPV